MSKPLKKVILIIIVTAVALYISLPNRLPINYSGIDYSIYRKNIKLNYGRINIDKSYDLKLGLDLAGGSHLVFDADTIGLSDSEKGDALDSVREVIEQRVNFFGISEPSVQVSSFEGKNRILVELPGVGNTNDAINLIGQTAQLEFVETGDGESPEFFRSTGLTGADLEMAQVIFDQNTGAPGVGIEFSTEGAEKFAELTRNNIGKVIPILLDGIPVSTPYVQQEIVGGSAQITGDFDIDEAKNLAIQLRAGALPVPISLEEVRTVGPSLGQEAIQKSIEAGLIGLGMVLLFMILLYGRFGIVAGIGLVIFGILTLALYKIIPVVLTLPGVAGFLLSVGMAVDSNILIFERFKEERDKHTLEDALEISFGRAWDSIRDANIATLVTAFILANPLEWSFLHTSGPVRGFAITLALGIAISMFTGIVVTRNLLRVLITEKVK